MYRLLICSALLAGLLVPALMAHAQIETKTEVKTEPKQESPKKDTGAKKPSDTPSKIAVPAIPGEVEIHFLNGSTVRMVVQSDKLEIATVYGKLFVPVKEVRNIEFGLHFPDEVETRIEAGVKSLGSTDYREREKASKLLTDLGPFSFPAVLEASRGKDSEIAPRAKEVIKKLHANHPKKDLKTSADDRVTTSAFTIVGRILTPTLKARTEYFGEVELALTKMRTMRSLSGPTLEIDVSVDAAKYANAGQWMETDFLFDGRSTVSISAKGFIDALPQNPGNGASGPNGLNAMRNGNMVAMMSGRKIGAVVNPQMHCGMLLGKIGPDGEIFIIGEHYEGTPETEGKLYLHIGPSQWNCQSMGSYDVKINRKS